MPMPTNREEMKGLYLSYDADSQILEKFTSLFDGYSYPTKYMSHCFVIFLWGLYLSCRLLWIFPSVKEVGRNGNDPLMECYVYRIPRVAHCIQAAINIINQKELSNGSFLCGTFLFLQSLVKIVDNIFVKWMDKVKILWITVYIKTGTSQPVIIIKSIS